MDLARVLLPAKDWTLTLSRVFVSVGVKEATKEDTSLKRHPKQHPIEKIDQRVESVTFHCPGKRQFVVLPQDVAEKIRPISQQEQQHVTKTHDDFVVHLRPHKVAQLKGWADLLVQEKAQALKSA